MINKYNKLSLLILLIILSCPHNVLAYTFDVVDPSSGEDSNESKEQWQEGFTKELGNKKYICSYQYSLNLSTAVNIDSYDIDNNELTKNSLTISEEDSIPAGTSMGISIIETKKINATGKIKITEVPQGSCKTWQYKCQRCMKFGVIGSVASISLYNRIKQLAPVVRPPGVKVCTVWSPTIYTQYYACGKYDKTVSKECYRYAAGKEKESENPPQTIEKECQSKLINTVKSAIQSTSKTPSYKIYLNDGNDIKANNVPDDENKIIPGKIIQDDTASITLTMSGNNLKSNKSATIKYIYQPYKVCMNVKTAQVKYLKTNTECDNTTEITVPNDTVNGKTHWHYFVPLNSKSINEFNISMLHNNSTTEYKYKACKQIMEKYPTEYSNLMKSADGSLLSGIDIHDDELKIRDGCYLQSIIRIPITQKFYNEVTDSDGNVKFKGFNFYYKPITLNAKTKTEIPKTIFPNGISKNSLWYEWGENWKKNKYLPDLSQSFTTVTYVAENINPQIIREYNAKNSDDIWEVNPYTSWTDMLVNGKSKLIQDGKVIKPNGNQQHYKLGCGPNNENWGECK